MDEATDTTTEPTTEPLSKADMQAFIKQGVQDSLRETLEQTAVQAHQSATQQPDNPFKEWIDPVVNPRLQQAAITAQAAEDKIDFYSSEQWLTELDDLLPGDSEAEIKSAKAAIRESLEKTFTSMLKAGKGTFRKDLIDYEIGKYIRENKSKVQESYTKRRNAKVEAELERARRGVDISSGAISNFQPQDVHGMGWDKLVEQYGNVGF